MSQNGNGKEGKVKKLLTEYGKMATDLKELKAASGVELLETSLERIKSEVTELTKAVGATISGDNFQAVYSPEKQVGSWNDQRVVDFTNGISDDGIRTRLLALREVKPRAASVSIRSKK